MLVNNEKFYRWLNLHYSFLLFNVVVVLFRSLAFPSLGSMSVNAIVRRATRWQIRMVSRLVQRTQELHGASLEVSAVKRPTAHF